MLYTNPGGHNWGPENFDGYGVSQIVFITIYSIFFFAGCLYVWLNRHHAALRMRKINLALTSILILHVYLFMIFLVYTLNGSYPCGVEFWTMSIYLPLGIGLFQAQNQQLSIVSQEQSQLMQSDEFYKLFAPKQDGKGLVKYWTYRFRNWWGNTSKQGKYEGFVFAGLCFQLTVSIAIYCLSRKFNYYGIISHPVSPALCRRGWEWIPSIVWQFMWNFFFGPYLIWKIRTVHDIYHWRLQTILSILAGLPGTPLWLAAVYTDLFASINKYWVPAMWFVPGLLTIEITTLAFPIYQVLKHNQAVRETRRILDEFDTKRLNPSDPSESAGSTMTRSTGSKGSGKMYSMESLDECLHHQHDSLQIYASCMELNGENIQFLVRTINFRKHWTQVFSRPIDAARARLTLFRAALRIYMSLVHQGTAAYPINVESHIYHGLEAVFGKAADLIAAQRRSSVHSSPASQITPWDEPSEPLTPANEGEPTALPLQPMMSTPPLRKAASNDSCELIINNVNLHDPLNGFAVPAAFDLDVFDPAHKSIRYMVWTETWQRYMQWNRTKEAFA